PSCRRPPAGLAGVAAPCRALAQGGPVNQNTLPSSLIRFESQLEHAIRRQRGRRSRTVAVRLALAGAVAGAAAVGVLSALPGGGPSVVERATAALAPGDGSILHIVLDGSLTGPDGVPTAMRIETWQNTAAPYDTREITTRGHRRFETGTKNGIAQLYDAATNTVYVSEIEGKGDVAPPPGRAT